MRRRDVVAGLAGVATAWSLGARAQQPPPVVGFLSSHSPEEASAQTASFLRGLAAFGYIDGQTVTVEYRWARGRYDRLPLLAKEVAGLHPAVIAAPGGVPSARAAKSASGTIPVIFVATNPVKEGLVAGLNRPGGTLSGVDLMTGELNAKRLELLVQLVPQAEVVGFLINQQNKYSQDYLEEVRIAARSLKRRVIVAGAGTELELQATFDMLAASGASAVVVQNDASFDARRDQIITLAAQHKLPAIYHIREYPAAGGLMSYGPNLADAYYQAGVQAARVLKGADVAELPVVRPTQFELVINVSTARTLGLTVPLSLIAQANEIIE